MVDWSEPAKKDLKQIHDYIAKDSKYYAKEVARIITPLFHRESAG